MSDDFGTINARRGERARELEVLRQHYRQHREALARMTMDAPTEHLAAEYQRLIHDIDRALGKLDELEGGAPPPPPPPPVTPIAEPVERQTLRRTGELPLAAAEPRSRVPLIIGAAVIALALIGWLIWRASSDRGEATIVAESDTAATVSTAADTAVEEAPAPAASVLTATPPAHDYGVIRKGTRAVRQFEITNGSDEPLSLDVARSACRCLYYEHAPVIPPKAKDTLTVTIDGGKAKAGELRERVKITKKNDPSVTAAVEVNATVQ